MELQNLEKKLFDEVEKYFDIKNGNFCYGNLNLEENNIEFNESGYSRSINLFNDEKHKNQILEEILFYIKIFFLELYEKSKVENYFWSYCSFRTYINTYEKRKNTFLDKYDDLKHKVDDFDNVEIYVLSFFRANSISTILEQDLLEKIEQEFNKKISFINSQKNEQSVEIINNSFSIFTSKLAEKLFERYFENFINFNNNKLAETSFIYRKMHAKGLIHDSIRPEMFKNYLSKPPYNTEISSSLKTYEVCKTKEREANFLIIYELVFKE